MTERSLTPSRAANLGARALFNAFKDFQDLFAALTELACDRFAHRDWAWRQGTRLTLYRRHVQETENRLRRLVGDRAEDRLMWVSMKAVYSGLIADRQDWDLAETWFNSVSRRVFTTVGVDPYIEFVDTDFDDPPTETAHEDTVRYEGADATEVCLQVLEGCAVRGPWADRPAQAARAGAKLAEDLAERGASLVAVVMLEPVFYRGKGAYLVGRIDTTAGSGPLVLCLRHGPRGIFVDAVLDTESATSILFSFTHSYFHVAVERPHDVVRFLRTILPRKRRAELYISIGQPRHGKTELFRDLRRHLEHTDEKFAFARGTPGLVMVVFTMPGYEVVFKVIRDHFPPEKQVTPSIVRDRYSWVYTHDRAGRLVDAQSFEWLALPRERFEPDVLDHLLSECGKSAHIERGDVVLSLAYLERRVEPLDLFARERPLEEAAKAVLEWGRAIRDLAACNIFPGDMLLKNFGVTRHGRVAFYDYDEVGELLDYRFREMPEPRTWEEEMASEPWYSVEPGDVFPEEFPQFLGLKAELRQRLMAEHRELFDARWWRGLQKQLQAGRVVEFAPYPPSARLEQE